MIGFKVDAAKGVFFDRTKVQNATTRTERRVLGRIGAFIRTKSRGLIRRRKRPSKPGKPPTSVTGVLKRFIFFVYSFATRSVVIGPAKVNAAGRDVPETLEHGGRTTVTGGRNAGERVDIDPRPYMGPALESELPKLPPMWRDAVK